MRHLGSILALAAALVVSGPAWAESDDDSFGEPAIAEPLDPEDVTTGYEDLHDMHGESDSIREHHAESEDPTKMTTGAEDLHDLGGSSEDPTKMRGEHEDISNLAVDQGDAQRPHPTPKLVAEPAAPGPNATSTEQALWRELQAAEANLDASVDTYENMMHNNYPRGERRERIIEERDAAIEAVNRARTRYAEAAGA